MRDPLRVCGFVGLAGLLSPWSLRPRKALLNGELRGNWFAGQRFPGLLLRAGHGASAGCPERVVSGGTSKRVQKRARCFLCSPLYAWHLGMPSFSGLLISLPGTGVNSLLHPHRGERWLGRGTCACWWNEGFRKPGTPVKPVHHLWSWSRAGLVVPWGTPDLQRKHTPEEAEA